ncbi:MAG: sigma-70 family RNA polymerase sigma factor [Actinomycetota bacterium]
MDASPDETDASAGTPEDLTDLSDSELVDLLRGGDRRAYEQLWLRHVGSARRVAARMTRFHADDLVSESFLAIYEQIHVAGKGPHTAFRAYLFAVMRNTAARWHREGRHIVLDPDVDDVADARGQNSLEREHDDAIMLHAFTALPSRWQRILWLSDVEAINRSRIAAELGIRPNAVSALHRRARNGLREQWLLQHVPVELRGDAEHIADKLPAFLMRRAGVERARISTHLLACVACRAVEHDLREAYQDGRNAAASVGSLAALGVVLPGAASLWGTPVSISIAAGAGVSLMGAASVLVSVLALTVGPTILRAPAEAQAGPPVATAAPSAQSPSPPAAIEPRETRDTIVVTPEPTIPERGDAVPDAPPAADELEPIEITLDGPESTGLPPRPTPRPPTPPGSVTPPGIPEPDGGEDGAPAAPAVTVSPTTTYFAPMLSGSAAPHSEVAVEVSDDTFVTESSSTGEWDFDLRTLQLEAGEYEGSVWSILDGIASPAHEFTFEIEMIQVSGMPEYTPITLRDSLGEGLVFTVEGVPDGDVCFDSDTGQSAMIALDESGSATARLRFLAYGLYVLRLTACDGDYVGATVPRTISVVEGVFDPWVVDDEMVWELSSPEDEAG